MMREFTEYRDRKKREYEEQEDQRHELRKGRIKTFPYRGVVVRNSISSKPRFNFNVGFLFM